MKDQYFGVKELYEVVLKAKIPMVFGERHLEKDEPVLYFEKIKFSSLTEQNKPIMARGGWLNMPQVIWEDRSEVEFVLTEGVMTNVSMGVLLSANVVAKEKNTPMLVPKREGPKVLVEDNRMKLEHWPVASNIKKTFIYRYENGVAQKKVYGHFPENYNENSNNPYIIVDVETDNDAEYIIDYYYQYKDEALIYSVKKERFTGLFTLEGKFYSKDENEGINYTNLIYMPKVRVVSDINLRLGENADPTISTFHIIGLPENQGGNRNGLILEITRLNAHIDEEI